MERLRSPCGLVVPAGQRERLERVCRYALRPPVARDRLRVTGDGQVLLPGGNLDDGYLREGARELDVADLRCRALDQVTSGS